MNDRPVTAVEAARLMGCSASQVRRWINQGAPVVRRERPALVCVADLQRWRQGRQAEALDAVARACLEAVRCEVQDGMSAPRLLGIPEARAAVLTLHIYDRAHLRLIGHEPDPPWPEPIEALRRIAGG